MTQLRNAKIGWSHSFTNSNSTGERYHIQNQGQIPNKIYEDTPHREKLPSTQQSTGSKILANPNCVYHGTLSQNKPYKLIKSVERGDGNFMTQSDKAG